MKKAIITPLVINGLAIGFLNYLISGSRRNTDILGGLLVYAMVYYGFPLVAVAHGVISLLFYHSDKNLPPKSRNLNLVIYLTIGLLLPLIWLFYKGVYKI